MLFKKLTYAFAVMGLATVAFSSIQPAQAGPANHRFWMAQDDTLILAAYDQTPATDNEDDNGAQLSDEYQGGTLSASANDYTGKDYYVRTSATVTAYNADDDRCAQIRRESPNFFAYGCSIWDTMRHGGSNSPASPGKSPCSSARS